MAKAVVYNGYALQDLLDRRPELRDVATMAPAYAALVESA